MKEIIGKKIGCTRIFQSTGEAIPVTVIECGPCHVVRRKTKATDGYDAYQVAFGKEMRVRSSQYKNRPKGEDGLLKAVERKGRKRAGEVSLPVAGQFAKSGVTPRQILREVRFDLSELEVGSLLKVDVFKEGERVDITGTSRGLGFAGSVKRHHFGGGPVTHGQSDRLRAPGSLGQSSFPSRVFKGLRMAGRMGNETVTRLNSMIIKIYPDENLMLVKGPVPGHRGALVKVRSTNRGR